MVLETLALFLVIEPVISQVVEPLVYGHSTGLSPVSVVISAIFWGWLWGAVGLDPVDAADAVPGGAWAGTSSGWSSSTCCWATSRR